jgi:signal transduction histidine kinase/DNA-binding response OmpR family regulator
MTAQPAAPNADTSILLVDDRPENLIVLREILAPLVEQTGVRLVCADGAEAALRHVLAEDGALAVVVLDVMMPGTDGLQTARLIRQRTRSEHIPIIFVTALDADRRRLTLGYQSGAVDYLTKPLVPEILRAKVGAFLDLHRRRGDAVLAERRRYADQVQALREQSLRDEAALVATLQRVGTALASELDLERVVQLVTDEATALTRAQFGAFFYNVIDPSRGGEAYTLYTLAGVPRERFSGFPHPRSTPVFGPTFRGEGVVRSDDITRDPRYGQMPPHHGMPPGHLPVRSYLAVPVRSRSGEVLGGLFFGHEEAGVFTEREERLIVGVAGWAAVAMDNARLYTAERHAREGAEGAARAKAEFLATMSHELRTPLNAILGYAQILDMGVLGPATPAQQAHLERLQASARHLLRLVDDVLDIAKSDADRLEVRRDVLMTGAAVAAAVSLVLPQATSKGVRLLDFGAGEPGVPYHGDEHRVRQVIVNLLSNAVKFTPPGGQVRVACGMSAERDYDAHSRPPRAPEAAGQPVQWSWIRVDDTGPGIAADLMDKLFEPFVQGDGALTREQGGTGLGLAISRRLARLMGGDVTVRTEPSDGASFTLWLPGAPSTAARSPARRTPERGTPALGSQAISDTVRRPMDDTAYAILEALSTRLSAESEMIALRYVAALRADSRFPGVKELPAVQLRDHATPFIGLIADQLRAIGETKGQSPDLLRDGGQLQRTMAELHGAQRYRLGWRESDIERETPLLRAEITRTLQAAVDTSATAPIVDPHAANDPATDADTVRLASEYAYAVMSHVLDQAAGIAIRAFRFARIGDDA